MYDTFNKLDFVSFREVSGGPLMDFTSNFLFSGLVVLYSKPFSREGTLRYLQNEEPLLAYV